MESFNPNRHLKEQFVSNLTGSSKLEIFILVTNLSILVLIRRCIGFNWMSNGYPKKHDNVAGGGKSFKAYVVVLLIDFLCIAVPYILYLTVLAEWTYWSTILVLLLLFCLKTFDRNGPSFLQEGGVDSIRENITSYRVSTMLVTCFSILAVDFKIFPRRYAKTETYGTSLMDLGVGSFVVANALVSRQARGIANMTLSNGLRSTSPLIILGFARLVSTSSVNYQVHVGEYGVHWNFFFTLAAVAILTLIINVHPRYCGVLGSFILIGYQALLLCGLNKYLLSEERKTDIFSQNKEGIFSIFGYWGMYLIGVRIGSYVFFGDNADAMSKTNKSAGTRAWALCMFFWSLTLLLDWYVEATSRRMCNMAYVSLILASNLQVLAIVMLFDCVPGCKSSAMEEAFSRNMLASFLLANVLTGVVNLSVDTLSVSSIAALAILFVYAFFLCFVVGIADFLGMKLKFW
ncbi:uncharacterized protein At4g17910-like [Salvia miltiorrhiza]|uniref:uncharacterized protein At4g17910-like n=1 Tax=Salvia miltiorrhiza TaxID=226208 RepID=UPI0025ABE556|nr:uncharacterized protein At4g17910-like [Salvia miltiorrhiza]